MEPLPLESSGTYLKGKRNGAWTFWHRNGPKRAEGQLQGGKRVGDYSAAEVLRVLFYCQASALPGVDFDTNGLLDELLKQQLGDGSVGSPELEAPSRVAASLDAMLFMLRLCRSGGQQADAGSSVGDV